MTDARLHTELVKLLERRERYEKARLEFEEAKAEREAQQKLVHELLNDLGVRSHSVDLGPPHGEVRFAPQSRINGTIYDEDAAFEAFEREGLTDELLKRAERKKVLNELVRERLEAGEPLPDGVSFYTTDYVQVTRKRA